MDDLISVIIPIYNAQKYLRECLDSVIGQKYKNLEIILINDGSIDQSGKICDDYAKEDKRIIVIHKINEGVSAARNKGIELAKGKWVTFIDADDWVDLDLFYICMQAKDEKDIIFYGVKEEGRNFTVSVNNDKLSERNVLEEEDFDKLMIRALNPYIYLQGIYQHVNSQGPYGKIIKSSLLRKNKVKFEQNLILGEDILFNLEVLSLAKKADVILKKMYHYRYNDESVLHKYNPNIFFAVKSAAESIGEFLKDKKNLQNGLFEDAYYVFVVRKFMYCVRLDYCSLESDIPYKMRRQMFLKDIQNDVIKISLKKIKLRFLKKRVPELVVAWLIKCKFFCIINLLNRMLSLKEVKNKQFEDKENANEN